MFNQGGRLPTTAWSTQSISAPPPIVARCRSVSSPHHRCAALSPFNAFLLLQGIETVAVRVDRHVENTKRVAQFLRDDPQGWLGQLRRLLRQPALSQHVVEKLSRRPRLLAADIRCRGWLRRWRPVLRHARPGQACRQSRDSKSLACHPASTTHRQMSAEEQRKAGVTPDAIRLSIGIEHIDDILADIDQALCAAVAAAIFVLSAEKKKVRAE